jgi:hypothetical protein
MNILQIFLRFLECLTDNSVINKQFLPWHGDGSLIHYSILNTEAQRKEDTIINLNDNDNEDEDDNENEDDNEDDNEDNNENEIFLLKNLCDFVFYY